MKAIAVPVLESERGWGSKIDDHMICESLDVANEFVKEFNSKNTAETAPDWYMMALNEYEDVNLNETQTQYLSEHKKVWWSSLRKM